MQTHGRLLKIFNLIKSKKFFTAFLVMTIVALCVLFTCAPIANYDLWWHLKTGEVIAETGQIPKTDIFSFTKYGQRWVTHEWLSELFLYFIKIYSGINGLIIFKILTIGFILFILYKLSSVYTHQKFLVLSLLPIFLLLSRHRFFVRPHLFTMFFFALSYLLLEIQAKQKIYPKKNLIIFPVLFLLWSNFHGGFLYGLLLIYLYFAILIFDYIKQKKTGLTFFFILSVICTLICLINPNGIDVFLYPLTIIKAGYVASNREWLSPFDNALSGYYMQKYFIVYSLILFTVLLINLKKICLKDILLPCLFFALAVKSQRNIALFAIISLPIFIKNISFSADKIIYNHKINAKIVKLFTIILFLFLIIFFYKYGVPIADKGRGFAKCGLGINKAVVPVDALDFIIKENISGNFFNSYQFGGYILYRGCPKIKVFIDGRADVYGKQLYHSFRKSLVIAEEFKKNMSKYNFNSVLLAYGPDNKALHDFLHQSKDWILVYFDSICLLYIKNTDKNLSVIKQYGYSFVNPIDSRQTNDEKIPALIDEYNKAITINPNVDYAYIRLAKLYRKKGDYINSLKISKKALKKFPNHYSILNQMGISYKYLDNYISAEKCFQKAVKANPYLLDAYGNLAVLYYEKNDFKKTRKFFKKTLRINPQDKIAKKILKEIGIN